MVLLQPVHISVLLRLENLVRQCQILRNNVRSLLFLLLDLSNQIFNHCLLSLELEAELLVIADGLATIIDDHHVHLANIIQLFHRLYQSLVLFFQVFVLLNCVLKFITFFHVQLNSFIGLNAS